LARLLELKSGGPPGAWVWRSLGWNGLPALRFEGMAIRADVFDQDRMDDPRRAATFRTRIVSQRRNQSGDDPGVLPASILRSRAFEARRLGA